MDGTEVRTWWTLNQPPEQIVPNLSLAIAGATGVSSSTAHLVPSLLLPDIIQGRRLAELNVTQRTANESIEGAECARLEVAPKSGDAMTLWIEKKTGLLRRTFQERSSASSRSETTITINGFVNGAIPEELLEFAAPPTG
jgi:hypothetical protein